MMLLSFLLGALLAQRFKVFVLVPAIALVLLLTVVIDFGHGASIGQTLGSALIEIAALQVGYLAGAGLHHLILSIASAVERRHSRGLDIERGRKPCS